MGPGAAGPRAHLLAGLCTLALCLRLTDAKAVLNPEFVGELPPRTPMDLDSDEVSQTLRFVLTELKRMSNRYRYIKLVKCHSAATAPANFNGVNTFLDLEFDMLRNQLSRHDIIVFRDGAGSITGMAIDEFPEVRLRELPDPDV